MQPSGDDAPPEPAAADVDPSEVAHAASEAVKASANEPTASVPADDVVAATEDANSHSTVATDSATLPSQSQPASSSQAALGQPTAPSDNTAAASTSEAPSATGPAPSLPRRVDLTPLSIPAPAATASTSAHSPKFGSPLKRRLSFNSSADTAAPSLSARAYEDSDSIVSRSAQNASDWNKLLGWVRRARGPQWDYATATYHVKKNSSEYFGGVTRVEGSSIVPPSAIGAGAAGIGSGLSGAGASEATGTESRRARRARAR
ncbi:hypothetical protein ACM66B_003418 [Microbotryomycetes sp. NB124-2]